MVELCGSDSKTEEKNKSAMLADLKKTQSFTSALKIILIEIKSDISLNVFKNKHKQV